MFITLFKLNIRLKTKSKILKIIDLFTLLPLGLICLLLFAKSTKGIVRLKANDRQYIAISTPTFEALVGLMLGDGHLQRRSINGNTRFMFVQSSKEAKLEYFNHVFKLFQPFCTVNTVPYLKTWKDNKTHEFYSSISFATMSLPCFNTLHDLFYNNKIKIVPDNIFELITEVGLAYWIMDDGSKHNNGLHLNAYAFDDNSIKLLLQVLSNKFNLECTIHEHTSHKNGNRIYIPESSMDKLRLLVNHHMVSSMLYKVGS